MPADCEVVLSEGEVPGRATTRFDALVRCRAAGNGFDLDGLDLGLPPAVSPVAPHASNPHHHLAASGNFGQVIRKNYPVCIGNRMDSASHEKASVVGPLCTPLDLLADQMELAVAEPGDLVVVFQSGAYGRSASPRDFLGHPDVAEALV